MWHRHRTSECRRAHTLSASLGTIEEKVAFYKGRGFMPPSSWAKNENDVEMPPDVLLEAVMAERPSIAPLRPEQEKNLDYSQGGVNCPAGQGYYEVVVVELHPETKVCKDGGVSVVIFCKEQILNRVVKSARPVLGWPTGAIRIGQAEAPGVHQPSETGVWSTMEEEIAWLQEAAMNGAIKEESPGTVANVVSPAVLSSAPATYSGDEPPEPPVPMVPTIERA